MLWTFTATLSGAPYTAGEYTFVQQLSFQSKKSTFFQQKCRLFNRNEDLSAEKWYVAGGWSLHRVDLCRAAWLLQRNSVLAESLRSVHNLRAWGNILWKIDDLLLENDDLCLKMMNFILKNDGLYIKKVAMGEHYLSNDMAYLIAIALAIFPTIPLGYQILCEKWWNLYLKWWILH